MNCFRKKLCAFLCSATLKQFLDNQDFCKKNSEKSSNNFVEGFWQNQIFVEKKFMFSTKIKKTLRKSLPELLAKHFSINVIIVLIIEKIIKFQKLKHYKI